MLTSSPPLPSTNETMRIGIDAPSQLENLLRVSPTPPPPPCFPRSSPPAPKQSKPELRHLPSVLTYLRLCDNQRYLVGRLFLLAAQRSYVYNGGGPVEDVRGARVDYKKDFPADADVWRRRRERKTGWSWGGNAAWAAPAHPPPLQILFHCLCCFFDDPSTLYVPSARDFLGGTRRSFTHLHVLKAPEVCRGGECDVMIRQAISNASPSPRRSRT